MSYSTADKEWFDGKPRPTVFQHQADATLSQANPVSGTKYTVLDTTNNAKIITIYASCTWTVQPTPLEIHVTIDGQPIIHTKANPVSAANNYATRSWNLAEASQLLIDWTDVLYVMTLYEGRSVKIEAEVTGGTVQNLSARVKYARIP